MKCWLRQWFLPCGGGTEFLFWKCKSIVAPENHNHLIDYYRPRPSIPSTRRRWRLCWYDDTKYSCGARHNDLAPLSTRHRRRVFRVLSVLTPNETSAAVVDDNMTPIAKMTRICGGRRRHIKMSRRLLSSKDPLGRRRWSHHRGRAESLRRALKTPWNRATLNPLQPHLGIASPAVQSL